jgi:hypothetical protein
MDSTKRFDEVVHLNRPRAVEIDDQTPCHQHHQTNQERPQQVGEARLVPIVPFEGQERECDYYDYSKAHDQPSKCWMS